MKHSSIPEKKRRVQEHRAERTSPERPRPRTNEATATLRVSLPRFNSARSAVCFIKKRKEKEEEKGSEGMGKVRLKRNATGQLFPLRSIINLNAP